MGNKLPKGSPLLTTDQLDVIKRLQAEVLLSPLDTLVEHLQTSPCLGLLPLITGSLQGVPQHAPVSITVAISLVLLSPLTTTSIVTAVGETLMKTAGTLSWDSLEVVLFGAIQAVSHTLRQTSPEMVLQAPPPGYVQECIKKTCIVLGIRECQADISVFLDSVLEKPDAICQLWEGLNFTYKQEKSLRDLFKSLPDCDGSEGDDARFFDRITSTEVSVPPVDLPGHQLRIADSIDPSQQPVFSSASSEHIILGNEAPLFSLKAAHPATTVPHKCLLVDVTDTEFSYGISTIHSSLGAIDVRVETDTLFDSPAFCSSDIPNNSCKPYTSCDPLWGVFPPRPGSQLWVPSPPTRELLDNLNAGVPVDYHLITTHTHLTDIVMTNPLQAAVDNFLGGSIKVGSVMDELSFGEDGCLNNLINQKHLRTILELTAIYLSTCGQSSSRRLTEPILHTHKTLQVWNLRTLILMRLGMFHEAEAELFGEASFEDFDKPDMYYEFYPETYPDMKGSMVPFCLRLMKAMLPVYLGKPRSAFVSLCALLKNVEAVQDLLASKNSQDLGLTPDNVGFAIQLWEDRLYKVHLTVANTLTLAKEGVMAMEWLVKMRELFPKKEVHLLTIIGRTALLFGNYAVAKISFNRLDVILPNSKEHRLTLLINRAVLLLMEGSSDEALQTFLAVEKADPCSSAAANNTAVCLTQLGKLKEAVCHLETFLQRCDGDGLTEQLVSNLAFLYHLDGCGSDQKKLRLLNVVARHCGDGFNVATLRL